MKKINLYKLVSREVSEILEHHFFEFKICEDEIESSVVIKFSKPLFGEDYRYAEECLSTASYFIKRTIGLNRKPRFAVVDPCTAEIEKSFLDSYFLQ